VEIEVNVIKEDLSVQTFRIKVVTFLPLEVMKPKPEAFGGGGRDPESGRGQNGGQSLATHSEVPKPAASISVTSSQPCKVHFKEILG
jgi:hypothetical protein